MSRSFTKLLKIAEMLRSEQGCPWDREQTIHSMLGCLIEEAGEVKAAINNNDYHNLQEELGDLLFNIVMISQIAGEQQLFTLEDVLKNITKKIKERHTWVFGNDKANTPEEALALWRKNKAREPKSS